MEEDNLQRQRFEFKYVISERVSIAIREFVRGYLVADEYGATLPDFSYPVHSLYLDSPDLKLYQSTINGDKNRFKLRLRFYENRPKAAVYFEIKRRVNNTISKQRGVAIREAVASILAGQLPSPDQVLSPSPKQHEALREFCRLISEMNARPIAHIAYRREAWMSSHDNSIRVTIDREICCQPESSARLETKMTDPVSVFGSYNVLELKFTNRFPDWFGELVRIYELVQCGAAKYVDGATLIGPERLLNASSSSKSRGGFSAKSSAESSSKHPAKPIQAQSHLSRREQILMGSSL